MNRSVAIPLGVAAVLAGSILAVGGAGKVQVWILAAVGALSFADLTRRGVAERTAGSGDATDVSMSVAFAVILVAAARDAGRDGLEGAPVVLAFSLRVAGLLLIAVGVALRRRAAKAMGENFLVKLGVREGHTLVQSGPFRRVRHPNYTALLSVALGTSVALASPLALAATFGLWLPIVFLRIGREERILIAEFGDAYRDYRARTWRLIPGLL